MSSASSQLGLKPKKVCFTQKKHSGFGLKPGLVYDLCDYIGISNVDFVQKNALSSRSEARDLHHL
jgi:hypothetical protein